MLGYAALTQPTTNYNQRCHVIAKDIFVGWVSEA